jgi:predicted nucleic acid-binding protein
LNESPRLPDRLSIDSGVILAYFLGEEIGALARSQIFEFAEKRIYHNRLCVAELFYVLCRRRGIKAATYYVHAFLDAGHSVLSDSDENDITAGVCKCERAVSLADCYVIATAKSHSASAVFARHEKDLDAEIKRKRFDVDVLFLEDLKV